MVEPRSLDELNSELERDLFQLKELVTDRNPDMPRIRERVEALHNILYSAIDYPASEVNATQLVIVVDPSRDSSNLPENGYKGRLFNYVLKSRGRNQCEESLTERTDLELILHLPYEFETGTHGSGDRVIGESSFPNLDFYFPKLKKGAPCVLVSVWLGNNWLDPKEVYLELDEIKALRLAKTDNSKFSPFSTADVDGPLKPAHTAEQHRKTHIANRERFSK